MATPTITITEPARFTPSPSCGIGTALYAVTKTCYMSNPTVGPLIIDPEWMTCTAVQAGEPWDKQNPNCVSLLTPLALIRTTSLLTLDLVWTV